MAGIVEITGYLDDSRTAKAIAEALPVEGRVQRWGGEIYFPVHVRAELESGCRDVLEIGELGYWPTGSAFCIFFGPTPASEGNEIRAASNVNVIGKLSGDLAKLTEVQAGTVISIEAID